MYDREAVSVSAVVSDTRGLPGQRIRLILDELVARDKPLPGKLVWTWDAPPQRLVPGTRVHIVLRVLPVGGFRNHGAFHEDCVNIIMKDLIRLMDPKYIEVTGIFTPRGGISIYPYCNYGRPGTKYEQLAEQRLFNHTK